MGSSTYVGDVAGGRAKPNRLRESGQSHEDKTNAKKAHHTHMEHDGLYLSSKCNEKFCLDIVIYGHDMASPLCLIIIPAFSIEVPCFFLQHG